MEHAFWHNKWANNQLGFHERQPNLMLTDHAHQLGLRPGGRVFVPLCGKTLDIGWLLSQGYSVVGVELNESAVRQLFDEMDIEPKVETCGEHLHFQCDNIDIYQGDFFALNAETLGEVDAVYDRAALVALPENMRTGYTQYLAQLSQKAPQLVVCYQYDQTQLDGPPFSISDEELHHHYQSEYLLTEIKKVDVEGGFKGKHPAIEKVWLLKPR